MENPDKKVLARDVTPEISNADSTARRFLQLFFLCLFCFALYRIHQHGRLVPFLQAVKTKFLQLVASVMRRVRSDDKPVRKASATPNTASAGVSIELSESISASASVYQPKLLNLGQNESALLTKAHMRELTSHLPSRVVGKDWQLPFSTTKHGYSLHTLYAKARHQGPTIVVVMDDQSNIFGGFASRDWSGNDLVTASVPYSYAMAAVRAVGASNTNTASYFGSGESFVFSAYPNFHVYRWTRRNNSFLLARSDCLAFGGGGGKFGLYLDANLEQGSSGTCETFANAPLASAEMFKVIKVEVWGFVNPVSLGRGPRR